MILSQTAQEEYLEWLLAFPNPLLKDSPVNRMFTTEEAHTAATSLEQLLDQSFHERPTQFACQDKYVTMRLRGHGETEWNERLKLTGYKGSLLTSMAATSLDGGRPTEGSVILSSHIPRTLQHALYLVSSAEEHTDLFDQTARFMEENDFLLSTELYREMLSRALANGIIPTPLLGPQFFGPFEGYIEKPEWIHTQEGSEIQYEFFQALRTRLDGVAAAEIISELNEQTRMRRHPVHKLRDPFTGQYLDSYVDFYNKTFQILFPLLKKLTATHGFKHYDIITHSGNVDQFKIKIRYNIDDKEFHVVRSGTPKKRGSIDTLLLTNKFENAYGSSENTLNQIAEDWVQSDKFRKDMRKMFPYALGSVVATGAYLAQVYADGFTIDWEKTGLVSLFWLAFGVPYLNAFLEHRRRVKFKDFKPKPYILHDQRVVYLVPFRNRRRFPFEFHTQAERMYPVNHPDEIVKYDEHNIIINDVVVEEAKTFQQGKRYYHYFIGNFHDRRLVIMKEPNCKYLDIDDPEEPAIQRIRRKIAAHHVEPFTRICKEGEHTFLVAQVYSLDSPYVTFLPNIIEDAENSSIPGFVLGARILGSAYQKPA